MIHPPKFNRRMFTTAGGVMLATHLLSTSTIVGQQDGDPPGGPTQAPFERDYEPPKFQPRWKKPQLNHQLVQDFILFAHADLDMTKTLLDKEPALLNATIDWGGGDFESALGGASHMGREDIVELLLSRGARMDIFCACMMGLLDVVRSMLTLQPALIDAKGPHGFNLHFHAQVGQERAEKVLDYLQSIKKLELTTPPFLKNKKKATETSTGKTTDN